MPIKDSANQVSIDLRIAEINEVSSGRGLCTAGIHVARRLNIRAGMIVEIVGKRTTGCIFFPNSADDGKQIIRADALVRSNAGVGLGEIVSVKKVIINPARRVVVSLTNCMTDIPPAKIRDALLNRPVVKGDMVSMPSLSIPITKQGELQEQGKNREVLYSCSSLESAPTTGSADPKRWPWSRSKPPLAIQALVDEAEPEGNIVQITPDTSFEIHAP